ncbi:restriction endonuclease subunit S [Zhongshania borealis]|uniref:Type I restriction modification DNA specificity domain-containing protein n=1 Tax=Zhongshania borealis TaxID=889488 RepID=A0ABP7W9N8_9GAMM
MSLVCQSVPLGDVCEFVRGPFGGALKKDDFVSEGYAVYEQQHAIYNQFEKIRYFVEESKYRDMARFALNPGDLIMSCSGTMGKVAIVPDGIPDGIINQALLKITPTSLIDINYLKYWMESNTFQNTLSDNTHGAAIKNVASVKILKALEIPLPPLKEQKRIVAILEKTDNLRRRRKEAMALADKFIRAIFLDMFGDPVTNQKGWEVKPLKEVARIQIGPFGTQLHKEDYIEGGIPLINPTHIVKGNIVPKSNLTIGLEKHASLPEYHLKAGDIVMGRRGEMGRCAIVGDKESGWMCGTGSLYIRPNKAGVFSEYLNKLLSSDAVKRHLESESQGATMANLNKTIVGNIEIPVPSDKVLSNFSDAKEKHQKIKTNLIKFSDFSLIESLSQKFFSGNL